MNRYRITNKDTGEVKEQEAEFLGQAVEALGWDIGNCFCEVLSVPEPKRRRGRPIKNPISSAKEEVAETGPEVVPPVPEDVIEKGKKIAQADQADAEAVDKFEKKLEEEIEKFDPHALSKNPTEAEIIAYSHKQEIETLAIGAEVMFLKMGQLLYDARVKGEWSILFYESYREYCEDLRLPVSASYSWATRLSAIYEYLVKNMKLDEKLLAEIGVAKLTRLLPLARVGELTVEVIEAARILSDLDLRAQLGHEVGSSSGDKVDNVVCPRCGEVFNAKTATRA